MYVLEKYNESLALLLLPLCLTVAKSVKVKDTQSNGVNGSGKKAKTIYFNKSNIAKTFILHVQVTQNSIHPIFNNSI